MRIADNVITLGEPFPAGSVGFGLDLDGKRKIARSTAAITGNTIQPASLPLAISGEGARVDVSENRVSAVVRNAAKPPRAARPQPGDDNDTDDKPSNRDGAA